MSTATHTEELVLDDPGTVADLRTFVSRARTADDGAIRLQGAGHVLAAYVCVMRGKLLGEGTPTILGMRTMALGTPSDIDVTVSLSSVADRLARMEADDVQLPVPPMAVHESWAGIGAPRGAWQELGKVPAETLIEVAKTGVQEIGQIIPVNPGALLVNNVRASVWGRTMENVPGEVPGGAAFAAYALGFVAPGEAAVIYSSHRWLRVSTARGHILIKPASLL